MRVRKDLRASTGAPTPLSPGDDVRKGDFQGRTTSRGTWKRMMDRQPEGSLRQGRFKQGTGATGHAGDSEVRGGARGRARGSPRTLDTEQKLAAAKIQAGVRGTKARREMREMRRDAAESEGGEWEEAVK
jgi:hypothetical protein